MTSLNPYELYNEDCLNFLKTLSPNSIDSLITDPPAGINLLNLHWDDDKGGRAQWIAWLRDVMLECHRVLKPGAYGFVWALPRTSHWTATALEDSGFKVKDIITHVFGTGFPKNMSLDKAIDRARSTNTDDLYRVTEWIRSRREELGLTNSDLDRIAEVKGGACHWTSRPPNGQPAIPTLERWQKLEGVLGAAPEWMVPLLKPAYQLGEDWEKRNVVGLYEKEAGGVGSKRFETISQEITTTNNPKAQKWIGWGTALKPASEHWIMIQKPIDQHNIAANILKHGVGGINIDATRIPTDDKIPRRENIDLKKGNMFSENEERSKSSIYEAHPQGRFPTNFLLSDAKDILNATNSNNPSRYFKTFEHPFFYCAKPPKKEKGESNSHPTIKPVNLMKYLCQMITPLDGIILDPFMGSGTTGVAAIDCGFRFLGVEREFKYFLIAQERISQARSHALELGKEEAS